MFTLQVSDEDIEDFEAEYRGSDQEACELLGLYAIHKGDMDMVSSSCITAARLHHAACGCGFCLTASALHSVCRAQLRLSNLTPDC